jgi:tRNA dimethylallyltransferase
MESGRELGRTARQAVGYREALAYLAGEYDHEEMAARILYRTRRFAKRQGTWFRSLSECRFVDLTGDVDASESAELIAKIAGR